MMTIIMMTMAIFIIAADVRLPTVSRIVGKLAPRYERVKRNGHPTHDQAFDEVLSAGAEAMFGAFDTTAERLGTNSQNVEKDFWVRWTLNALFHGLPEASPRLLFKGGTSLSKGFGLISRFSEDTDVIVFRQDIGASATVAELEALSGKKRKMRLDAIRDACRPYVGGPMREALTQILSGRLTIAGLDPNVARIELDETDRRPDVVDLVSRNDFALGLCALRDQDRVRRQVGTRPEPRGADQALRR
jgi:nucleotidyltransferase AbiEii toxin of type IV toxin-antitoxin system